MKAIEIVNLTKKFGDRVAVDSLSLSIEKGEFFSLLGQNGAGKTTTIKMLSCLITPTSGDAVLLGDSIKEKRDAVKGKINISPQETAVAPNLTVVENLEFMAMIYGFKRKTAKDKADEYMHLFGLSDRSKDRAKLLSGGLKRRLSIAMALITEPLILFLDEPTLGLDVRARREMWKLIEELKDKVNIVLTTHYLEEAEALSDRVGIMHKGRLQALGSVDEIISVSGTDKFEDAFLALTDDSGGVF